MHARAHVCIYVSVDGYAGGAPARTFLEVSRLIVANREPPARYDARLRHPRPAMAVTAPPRTISIEHLSFFLSLSELRFARREKKDEKENNYRLASNYTRESRREAPGEKMTYDNLVSSFRRFSARTFFADTFTSSAIGSRGTGEKGKERKRERGRICDGGAIRESTRKSLECGVAPCWLRKGKGFDWGEIQIANYT